MGRPKSIISKSELAVVLGLSRGRITQLSKREDFPSRPDGRVDRERAVKWYRDVGLAQQSTKRGPKPKAPAVETTQRKAAASKASSCPPPAAAVVPVGTHGGDAHGATSEPTYIGDARGLALRELFERLIGQSGRIPGILCEAGFHDPLLLAIAPDLFCDFVFSLSYDLASAAYDWAGNDDRSPTPVVNMKALARKYGFQFDLKDIRLSFEIGSEASTAEALLSRFDTPLGF